VLFFYNRFSPRDPDEIEATWLGIRVILAQGFPDIDFVLE
jgi:hypothetical protein